MKFSRVLAAIFLLTIFPNILHGNERRFAYTYQSAVLPAGVRELELCNTFRSGKDLYFRALDRRLEFEFGVSNNLMSALYVNYDNSNQLTDGKIISSHDVSISNEWKYKLSDPVADAFGSALYGEWTLGTNEADFEAKLILDKQVSNWLFAVNIVGEHEWETALKGNDTETETELKGEVDFGIAYFITPHFSVGIEARQNNVIKSGEVSHSALFFGPVISYSASNWWATLAVQPQVMSLKGASTLDLEEYERVQARLLFSFAM